METCGLTRRIYSVAAILFIGAVAVRYIGISDAAVNTTLTLQQLPERIGTWQKFEDITYKKKIFDILGTQNVVSRTYRDEQGRSVHVMIVQAVNNRAAFHPPEYCLTGGGSEITERTARRVELPGQQLQVNEMKLVSGAGSRFMVWNWYCAGRFMTPSFYRQQLRLVYDQLVMRKASGAVINLYVDIVGNNDEDAVKTQGDFTGALLPVLSSYL